MGLKVDDGWVDEWTGGIQGFGVDRFDFALFGFEKRSVWLLGWMGC